MGRGNSELIQTQKHLYHPSPLQPQRRYLKCPGQNADVYAAGSNPAKTNLYPAGLPFPRQKLPHAYWEKPNRLCKDNHQKEIKFSLVFLCHKKDDTGVPNKLENFHSKKELIICHKPQTGTLLLNFQLKVKAGHRCFQQKSYTCTDFQKQSISRITDHIFN